MGLYGDTEMSLLFIFAPSTNSGWVTHGVNTQCSTPTEKVQRVPRAFRNLLLRAMKTLKKFNYHYKFGRLCFQWAIGFGTPEVRISKGKTTLKVRAAENLQNN